MNFLLPYIWAISLTHRRQHFSYSRDSNGQEANFLYAFVIEVWFKSEHWSWFLLEELQLQAFTRAYKEL